MDKLDLIGGSGEKPREEKPGPGFVFDPTPEEIAAMDDGQLYEFYGAMVEYDASGGRVLRNLKREIDRRARA